MNSNKRFLVMALVMLLMTTMFSSTVYAGTSVNYSVASSGKGKEIKVRSVKYDKDDDDDYDDNKHEIEVKFRTKVRWSRTAKVSSVKDNKGKKYTAWLNDTDSDDCDIYIKSLKSGRTYTIVIDGIKKSGAKSYGKLTLKVKIPSDNKNVSNSKLKVTKVEFDDDNDDEDRYGCEIDIKFNTDVVWKSNAKVSSIKDNKGKSYKGVLNDRDDDSCEVYIKNMTYGRTYTIKISGIKVKGASSYTTVTAKVKVPNKEVSSLTVKKVEYEEDYDNDYDDDDYDDDYDYDDKEEYKVKIEFRGKVRFKNNAYVIIKDSTGKEYSTKHSRVELDDDECEVYLNKGLVQGKKYYYEVVGVKARNSGDYTTVKGSFIA